MTPDQMTELKAVAAVLRQAKARIKAVHDAVDKEQQGASLGEAAEGASRPR
jgi:hypothetical protein